MIEKEYKFLLNKDTFIKTNDTVSAMFSNSSSSLQINYYYDDEQYSLNKQNITLRVRQTGETIKLQKKHHIIKSSVMPVISDETERIITNFPKVIDGKYYLKGSLVTHRCRISTNKSVYFDFDINYYLGICDYEVEIEFGKNANQQAEIFIACLGLKNVLPVQGKASRFFRELNK